MQKLISPVNYAFEVDLAAKTAPYETEMEAVLDGKNYDPYDQNLDLSDLAFWAKGAGLGYHQLANGQYQVFRELPNRSDVIGTMASYSLPELIHYCIGWSNGHDHAMAYKV